MKKFFLKDSVLIFLLIAITCACYFPIMPHDLTMMGYSLVVILFAVLAFVSWHEKAIDEREEKHRSIREQFAFFAGGMVLIIGIAYQGLSHERVDLWLIGAFSAMLLGRVIGRIWAVKHC